MVADKTTQTEIVVVAEEGLRVETVTFLVVLPQQHKVLMVVAH
jgi:hypothetical protein